MRRSSAAPSPEEEDRREPDENKYGQKDATDMKMKVRHVDATWPCTVVLNGWSRLAERAGAHGVLAAPSVRQAFVGDVSDPDDHDTGATVEQCIIAMSIRGFTWNMS